MKTCKPFIALTAGCALAAIGLTHSTDAATVFLTNNTSPKTLASNQGDAAGLEGVGAGDTTPLTLSADDGGGTINLTTTGVSAAGTLGMDADSMGNGNDKWGNSQNWTFTFDQPISFDALGLTSVNETLTLKSDAWLGDADASGTNWSFAGSTGAFSITGTADLTGAGVSNVAAGTEIGFGFFGGANGGEQLNSFTITVIPEPGSLALLGLGGLLIARRRR